MNSIKDIVNLLEENGFSIDNLVFGSGGKLIFLLIILIKFSYDLF
jgi:hypothetical protein